MVCTGCRWQRLPAALAAASLHTAIRLALRMHLAPTDVLRVINEEFYDPYTRTDLLATVVIACFDPHTNTLALANAGHPPVLVRQGHEWVHLPATAPPVGVLPTLDAELQTLTLQPGDLIVCYSDGFSEIQTPAGLWGQSGLLDAIPNDVPDVNALTRHIVAAAQGVGIVEDDQTLVTALYTGND
ncbi:MAG: serine/threonine-protein phosphatase [Chloroflexaceae bacterium]|nr:serine/threonine-protein phosphatase [Chloroflexaceae bacterium]